MPVPAEGKPVAELKRSRSRSPDRRKSGPPDVKQPETAVGVDLHALIREASLQYIESDHSSATRPVCTKLVLNINGVELRAIMDARGATVRRVFETWAAHWDSPTVGFERASLTKYWPGPVSEVKTYREQLEDGIFQWMNIEELEDGVVRPVAHKV
ncbi:hypothetical protein JCM10295v2_003559 [Rhodotorula toruloides]